VGYPAFDILVLWASFRAVGSTPELTIVWAGYLIGQLGNWLPVPGGIGGVEGGLIGVLILYGLQAVTATAAVLLYRVIDLWIPAVLGAIAFVQLRGLLRRESDAIDVCQPGDVVEIVGVGPMIVKQAAFESALGSLPPSDGSPARSGWQRSSSMVGRSSRRSTLPMTAPILLATVAGEPT
jgi:hypothetical protein